MLTQQFAFYQTYLDLAMAPQQRSRFFNFPEFRAFVLQERGHTLEAVKLMAPQLVSEMVHAGAPAAGYDC